MEIDDAMGKLVIYQNRGQNQLWTILLKVESMQSACLLRVMVYQMPIESNSTVVGRDKNRRVELKIVSQE